MERADASGGGLDRRLCLERQDLSEPHEDRVCDHRHPLEWTQILWVARQTVEGICTMNARSTKVVRCAIYTRVSTDQGLEQDFNSLDAQYDASQAYIRSQAHAGWSLLRAKYDDGGFSGALAASASLASAMLLPNGLANTRCSVCRFEPGDFHVQLSPAPGTGLQSPETGSRNRRYRDLGRQQRP